MSAFGGIAANDRNNIDTIVGELQRIGYWNGLAAGASRIAALLLGVGALLDR
jgi:hypothetical protein